MLFIIHNSEDGLRCETIDPGGFDAWVQENTEGVDPDYHPRFVAKMPTEESDSNEFIVIDGRVLVPQPTIVVKTYTLDRSK